MLNIREGSAPYPTEQQLRTQEKRKRQPVSPAEPGSESDAQPWQRRKVAEERNGFQQSTAAKTQAEIGREILSRLESDPGHEPDLDLRSLNYGPFNNLGPTGSDITKRRGKPNQREYSKTAPQTVERRVEERIGRKIGITKKVTALQAQRSVLIMKSIDGLYPLFVQAVAKVIAKEGSGPRPQHVLVADNIVGEGSTLRASSKEQNARFWGIPYCGMMFPGVLGQIKDHIHLRHRIPDLDGDDQGNSEADQRTWKWSNGGPWIPSSQIAKLRTEGSTISLTALTWGHKNKTPQDLPYDRIYTYDNYHCTPVLRHNIEQFIQNNRNDHLTFNQVLFILYIWYDYKVNPESHIQSIGEQNSTEKYELIELHDFLVLLPPILRLVEDEGLAFYPNLARATWRLLKDTKDPRDLSGGRLPSVPSVLTEELVTAEIRSGGAKRSGILLPGDVVGTKNAKFPTSQLDTHTWSRALSPHQTHEQSVREGVALLGPISDVYIQPPRDDKNWTDLGVSKIASKKRKAVFSNSHKTEAFSDAKTQKASSSEAQRGAPEQRAHKLMDESEITKVTEDVLLKRHKPNMSEKGPILNSAYLNSKEPAMPGQEEVFITSREMEFLENTHCQTSKELLGEERYKLIFSRAGYWVAQLVRLGMSPNHFTVPEDEKGNTIGFPSLSTDFNAEDAFLDMGYIKKEHAKKELKGSLRDEAREEMRVDAILREEVRDEVREEMRADAVLRAEVRDEVREELKADALLREETRDELRDELRSSMRSEVRKELVKSLTPIVQSGLEKL